MDIPPPPFVLPTEAVPLLAVKLYLLSLTLVILYPAALSSTVLVKESKLDTDLNLTVSSEDLPWRGSVTVITEVLILPEEKAFNPRRFF